MNTWIVTRIRLKSNCSRRAGAPTNQGPQASKKKRLGQPPLPRSALKSPIRENVSLKTNQATGGHSIDRGTSGEGHPIQQSAGASTKPNGVITKRSPQRTDRQKSLLNVLSQTTAKVTTRRAKTFWIGSSTTTKLVVRHRYSMLLKSSHAADITAA